MTATANDGAIAFLAELRRGGELILDNAEQLYNEAILLGERKAFARAVCLHQLSNEECAKTDFIGVWATSLVLGHEVDVRRITRALQNHKTKNHTNAYFLEPSEDELRAREQGDWTTALRLFRERQAGSHRTFNDQKNAALYVNFENGTFSAPKDVIAEGLANEMRTLNRHFLDVAAQHVRQLRTLETNDRDSRNALRRFAASLREAVREHADDPVACLSKALEEMLDAVKPGS
jgi:AbiV family abortive infection protein